MKKALKIFLPPLGGLIFTVVAVLLLFIVIIKVFSTGASAFDFSYGFKVRIISGIGRLILMMLILFGIQALLVLNIKGLFKVSKIAAILLLICLVGTGFVCYMWQSNFNHSIVIGASLFLYLLLFYCVGNGLTLYVILRKTNSRKFSCQSDI